VSLASKLKAPELTTLAPIIFFVAVGIIFLALLPFSGFPPHIGLIGTLSLIAAYGLLKKRFWAMWLVGALFVAAMTLSLYTLMFAGFSNLAVGLGMVAYAILTLVVTVYLVLKSRPAEV
jgi:ABC-type glycerol-3-phosphate transport system permease component